MKFSDLKKQLDNGTKSRLYVFTGAEKEVMNRYIKRIDEKPQRAKTITEIIPKLTMNGLFASTSTYVIEDDKAAAEMDLDELLKIIGRNTVILVFKDIDKRKKLFKNKKLDGYFVEFNKFQDHELLFFINKIIDVPENLGILIANYCDNDVARIENECQKLKLLGKEITEELVKELIHPPVEDRIFDMIDFIAKKKPEAVFKLYYDLLELKESPVKMISVLYTKFKHVFQVQSYFKLQNVELAGKTGLTFFQVNSARNVVGQFTVEELLYFMQQVQKTEVAIKTGEIDQYVGMENLLVQILK